MFRGTRPMTAALDPDDLIGPVQVLRFRPDELHQAHEREVPRVERTCTSPRTVPGTT
jgi:hypothetical protein